MDDLHDLDVTKAIYPALMAHAHSPDGDCAEKRQVLGIRGERERV